LYHMLLLSKQDVRRPARGAKEFHVATMPRLLLSQLNRLGFCTNLPHCQQHAGAMNTAGGFATDNTIF